MGHHLDTTLNTDLSELIAQHLVLIAIDPFFRRYDFDTETIWKASFGDQSFRFFQVGRIFHAQLFGLIFFKTAGQELGRHW